MFGIDAWFGNLKLLISYMLDDEGNTDQPPPEHPSNGNDNGQKLEKELHRFEGEGGPPQPPDHPTAQGMSGFCYS